MFFRGRGLLWLLLSAAVVIAGLGDTNRAHAALIAVDETLDELNADGDCSLREAIEAANTDAAVDACVPGSGPDTIELPPGSYPLTITGAFEDQNLTGDLDLRSDITIIGTGSSPSVIDASGLGNDRVMHIRCVEVEFPDVPVDIDVTLHNLRLTNGFPTNEGGAVRVDECLGFFATSADCNLTVEDSEFEGNSSRSGGGLWYQSTGALVVLRSTFMNNVAELDGGGMTLRHGEGLVEDSVFEANTAQAGGGLKAANASLTIRRSSFTNNVAELDGGGLDIFAPTLIEDSTIAGNQVTSTSSFAAGGGGLMINSTTTIRRTTISGNSSGTNGGGVACQNATATLENSTISDNVGAGQGGGGLILGLNGSNPCTITIDSCTITGNSGSNGGGCFRDSGSATVANTIIAGNTATWSGPDAGGLFTSGGHNLIGIRTSGTGFAGPNDLVGTAAKPLDPLLGALQDNGGATQTQLPEAGSPALDTGATGLVEDQRGLPRPATFRDRGAVEVQPSVANVPALSPVGSLCLLGLMLMASFAVVRGRDSST